MREYFNSPEWLTYKQLMKDWPEMFAQSELIPIETDEDVILQYMEKTGKKIGVLYQSPYSLLVVDLVRGQKGQYFTYERILPAVKTGAVVTVPVCDDGFVLLKQYRHALRGYQYAFPRGFGEKDISAEENVKKELREEIDVEAGEVHYIGNVFADSGLCGNRVQVYRCRISKPKLKYQYEGIEEVIVLQEDQLEQWIRDGKIDDGYTLAAYSLYKTDKAGM